MEVGRFFNAESMDLNVLYQQDVDLGVNWQMFDSVKNLKEVPFEEKLPFDPKDYIVDGETGEFMPVAQKEVTSQKAVDNDAETGQAAEFDIEDFLEASINSETSSNVQPVSQLEQSFQSTQSNETGTINTELWDDIATLSEAYLALDSGEFANEGTSDKGSPMEDNIQQFHPVNQFQTDVYSTQGQINMPEQQKSPSKDQYFAMETPYHSFPTPPYADQTESPSAFAHPTSVTFPPETEKSFGPADLEEAKLAEMLMTQQNELLTQLDNATQINLGNNVPPPLHAEEVTSPGSWFFGGDEPNTNFTQVLTELDILNNVQNQVGSYLNPPNAPYVPPPIRAMDVVSQGRVSMLSESESLDGGFSDVGMMEMDIEQEQGLAMSVEQNYVLREKNQDSKFLSKKSSNRESRDLKKARELNISLTMDQIINSSVEEYNELLARSNLSPAQQSLVRDIRRRGKNKVAAQNCRKRKIETISSMETDIDGLNMQRQDLMNKQKEIEKMKRDIQAKYNKLYQQIFNSLRDDSGRPFDRSRYSLQQVEGAIILVPGNYGNSMGEESSSSKMNTKGTVAFFDLSKVKMEKNEM